MHSLCIVRGYMKAERGLSFLPRTALKTSSYLLLKSDTISAKIYQIGFVKLLTKLTFANESTIPFWKGLKMIMLTCHAVFSQHNNNNKIITCNLVQSKHNYNEELTILKTECFF